MSMLAVMVRYNTPLGESETVKGVCEALTADTELRANCDFMIWDNSPERLVAPDLPIEFDYAHSEQNLGVSGAYNNATRTALERGHEWMLLLDQDTHVTADFMRAMLRWSEELKPRSEIAVIAPTVRVGKMVVSPRRHLFNRHRAYADTKPGVAEGEAFAINSGCLMRVAWLKKIGGFSSDFWLDYSDIYACHQFFLRGGKLWRATDAELEHDMTVMDYDRLMSPWRYTNFSQAESAFNDLYKGYAENAMQNVRLLARSIKQRRKYRNPEFARITLAQLIYRLTVPRRRRIQKWIAAGEERRAKIMRNPLRAEQRVFQ